MSMQGVRSQNPGSRQGDELDVWAALPASSWSLEIRLNALMNQIATRGAPVDQRLVYPTNWRQRSRQSPQMHTSDSARRLLTWR